MFSRKSIVRITRFFLKDLYPTQERGVALDLREMGPAQGKGMREGQAPQARREISSQLPARKETT